MNHIPYISIDFTLTRFLYIKENWNFERSWNRHRYYNFQMSTGNTDIVLDKLSVRGYLLISNLGTCLPRLAFQQHVVLLWQMFLICHKGSHYHTCTIWSSSQHPPIRIQRTQFFGDRVQFFGHMLSDHINMLSYTYWFVQEVHTNCGKITSD